MGEGWAQIAVRRSLLLYTLKRISLDIVPVARRLQGQQIVPLNREEVIG